MADITHIQWAHATWNPWMGCHKRSIGCLQCYMHREMKFYGKNPATVVRTSPNTFHNPLRWAKNGKVQPGSRIFVCSWSDFFIEEADAWRNEAWEIVKMTSQFIYIIPTKRPERIQRCLPPDWGQGYPNVWLLVSTENQEMFERRFPVLEHVPAKVKGISAEPLLGHIDIGRHKIDWLITGGESDKRAPRPCNIEWVRSLRDQCMRRGIPYFHKQHGGIKKIDGAYGGRALDGHMWEQFPQGN
jgi:protein gp37